MKRRMEKNSFESGSDRPRPGDSALPTPTSRTEGTKFRRADPEDSPPVVERLEALAHELGNLLDGSMRTLLQAERSLGDAEGGAVDDARRRLDTVRGSLERMADLVHAAMRGTPGLIGSRTFGPGRPVTLAEAIRHAADVVRPDADDLGITIDLRLDAGAETAGSGPVYPIVLNGLRNAVEAIAACRPSAEGKPGGCIEVHASVSPAGRACVLILDDGPGLPTSNGEGLFRHGFTTKPGGRGIGLSLSRSVVRELPDGAIELRPRTDLADRARPGAALEVRWIVRAEDRRRAG